MTIHPIAIGASVVALAGMMIVAAGEPAQALTMKECGAISAAGPTQTAASSALAPNSHCDERRSSERRAGRSATGSTVTS